MRKREDAKNIALRALPQVNELVESIAGTKYLKDISRDLIVKSAREVLREARETIINSLNSGTNPPVAEINLLAEKVIERVLRTVEPSLRKVVNATGTILHTNLGRAPLSPRAIEAVSRVSEGYCNLEYDLLKGERRSRQQHIEPILREICGAESAFVVNNNAAAVLIVLSTLAKDKEVIISRGELIEIGESFRLPDIMRESGAVLVEVGTTNRTRIADYANAITERTALLMKVHKSNYRIVGFTEEVSIGELARLGKEYGLLVVEDLGSGALVDLSSFGLKDEPTPRQVIAQGASLVTMSADKLLGGPQAGIIAGNSVYVERIRRNPLARAVRIDKMILAALEATLREYLYSPNPYKTIPILGMLTEDTEKVRRRALKLKRTLDKMEIHNIEYSTAPDKSRPGGGSLPLAEIPTYTVAVKHKSLSVTAVENFLISFNPPIISRIRENSLLLDMRTVTDEEVGKIAEALKALDRRASA